ncbi:phage tail terminator family protein [Streptococcus parasuis]
MINKIIDAISISLNSAFGDGYEIYTESIEQGLQEPCFSVFCLNPTNNLFRNNKYFRNNQFCIQYFPSTDEPKAECNTVLEKLFDCMELITVNGDLTRGSRMNGEVVDGVLNFFINYNMFVYKVEVPADNMEVLGIETDAKGW